MPQIFRKLDKGEITVAESKRLLAATPRGKPPVTGKAPAPRVEAPDRPKVARRKPQIAPKPPKTPSVKEPPKPKPPIAKTPPKPPSPGGNVERARAEIRSKLGDLANRPFEIETAIGRGITPKTLLEAKAITPKQHFALTDPTARAREKRKNEEILRKNREVDKQERAINELRPFIEGSKKRQAAPGQPGQFTRTFSHNLPDAILAGKTQKEITAAGYTSEQFDAAFKVAFKLSRTRSRKAPEPDTRFGTKLRDVLKEGMTFTTAETETFNRKDLGKRYDKLKKDIEREYDAELRRQGAIPSKRGREQTVALSIGKKDVWVSDTLKAQPTLKKVAKEVGLASIPVYGTWRTWDESPGWLKAVNVASDFAFLIPGVGFAAKGARTVAAARGLKRAGIVAANVAVAEAKAPFNTILKPIRALKGTVQPYEGLVIPNRIPFSTIELKTATLRLPFEAGAAKAAPGALRTPRSVIKDLPISDRDVREGLFTRKQQVAQERRLKREGITPPITPAQAMEARAVITRKAILGERAIAEITPGLTAEIPIPPITKMFGPAAMHSSPDLRNFYTGAKIGGRLTRDSKGKLLSGPSKAEGKDLYLAPGSMTRFQQATSGGGEASDLSEAAWTAIKLGELSKDPIPGTLLIREPDVLAALTKSRRPYIGTAEIEELLKNGFDLPLPSQALTFRNTAGEVATLLIIGKPFTKLQIAKMKFVGPAETVKSIFRPSGKIRKTPFAGLLDDAIEDAEKAEDLFKQSRALKKAGKTAEASAVRKEAVEFDNRASRAISTAQEDSYTSMAHGMNLVQVYYGNQDIKKAFDALAKGRKPSLRDRTRGAVKRSRASVNLPQRTRQEPTRRPIGGEARARAALVERARIGTPGRRAAIDVPRRGKTTIPKRGQATTPRPATGIPERPIGGIPERPIGGIPERPIGVIPGPRTGIIPGPRTGTIPAPSIIPPPTPAIGRFQLPDGKKLKRGIFPRVVTWRQGAFNITLDIDSGRKFFKRSKPTKQTPSQTFNVLTKDKTRPRERTFRQGNVLIDVTTNSLSFRGIKRRRGL